MLEEAESLCLRRQEHARQNRDEGDDDQQFDDVEGVIHFLKLACSTSQPMS